MASWDDVKSRISWAGKATVVRTRTVAQIATVNGKISDTRKNINAGCLELGRILVDSEYADDTVEDIEERIDKAETTGEDKELLKAVLKVKKFEEELDELVYEKGQLQGITPCRICGAEVTADSEYCCKCGASVVPEDDPSDGEPDDGPDIGSEEDEKETDEAEEPEGEEEPDDEEAAGPDDAEEDTDEAGSTEKDEEGESI